VVGEQLGVGRLGSDPGDRSRDGLVNHEVRQVPRRVPNLREGPVIVPVSWRIREHDGDAHGRVSADGDQPSKVPSQCVVLLALLFLDDRLSRSPEGEFVSRPKRGKELLELTASHSSKVPGTTPATREWVDVPLLSRRAGDSRSRKLVGPSGSPCQPGDVLTEAWDMAYEFERPPRWNPRLDPRPAIVYLDHWCWDHLARDRAGLRGGEPDEGMYAYLKKLVDEGSIVLPLTQAHYREHWVRTNDDARWDMAVVMAELTGFTTFNGGRLADWQALNAVESYFGLGDVG
jgi:hypothetical protein